MSPMEDGKDVIQYRCEKCGAIERVSSREANLAAAGQVS